MKDINREGKGGRGMEERKRLMERRNENKKRRVGKEGGENGREEMKDMK